MDGELRVRPVNGKKRRRSETPPVRKGPKTKLNDKVMSTFCRLTRRGLPPDGVCDYIGIAPTTFWNWIKRGELYINGDCSPPEFEVYGTFVMAFRKALAQYRLARLDQIHTPGNKDWYKEMAVLERRDRKSFGRVEPQGGSFEDYDPDARFL